jgi:hypothetical protein
MGSKILFGVILLTTPAVADPRLFDKIQDREAITLVLPNGPCDAKVVRREPEELTVRLKSTTSVCGKRRSLVMVSRSDIQDVVERRRAERAPDPQCALIGMTAAATTAGRAVGELTGNYPAMLAIIAGGGIAGALVCREGRHTPYVVYTDRLVPAQP